MKFKVIDDAELRDTSVVSFMVCAPAKPLYLADNVVEPCGFCGAPVQHRPDVPPMKLACMKCYSSLVKPDDTALVSRTSLLEAMLYFANGRPQ